MWRSTNLTELRVTEIRRWLAVWLVAAASGLASAVAPPAATTTVTDGPVLEARDAAKKRDRSRLAGARAAAQAGAHPLLPWVEYWDLSSRLSEARGDEVEAFYARWPGSYVEDRLRNDWLLELGKRRDFTAIARDYPRFKMNDDREVTCWGLLSEHLAGRDVREPARAAWFAQREADDGCNMLATAMVDAKRFSADDVWRKARLAIEANRPAAAKAAVALLGAGPARDVIEALDSPAKFLKRSASPSRNAHELRALAVARWAASDAEAAASQLNETQSNLSASLAAWAWAYTGRQSAFKLSTDAVAHYQRALELVKGNGLPQSGWTDETLAWGVRALLRGAPPAQRWPAVIRLIDAMSATEQREPAWAYWRARALQASARTGSDGDGQRAEARQALMNLASPLHFYGQLAAEDLGPAPALPPLPLPASATERAAERDAARSTPGLARAILLVNLGLRDEARREWNFSLRGMSDRELLAAARLACELADWQLCINTAERSKQEIDVSLRYPMPFAADITQAAITAGLEPAFVFGLIRQETRFMPQLRSSVGATGLMQVMPATGRWVAKKIGIDLGNKGEALADPQTNLRLGTGYLKLVLDDLGGSQPMAAAAYNAGPGRPRRWRDGPVVEPAIWAENVPFNETRDYVKKVLSNTAVYAALMANILGGSGTAGGNTPTLLKARLGSMIGPRDTSAPAPAPDLP